MRRPAGSGRARRGHFPAARGPGAGRDLRSSRCRWRAWCSRAAAAAFRSNSTALEKAAPRRDIARPKSAGEPSDARRPAPHPALELFNGLGGFAKDGREYVVVLGPGQTTPAPWINVIANADFGFQVSAEGSGYTWAGNSRENQITPWSNDPVGDRPGEAFYLREEDDGRAVVPDRAARCAIRGRSMSPAMATATAASNTPRTALPATCCNSCRRATRSKMSRLRLRNTTGAAAVYHGLRLCRMGARRLAQRRRPPLCETETRRRDRRACLRAIRGTRSSVAQSPSCRYRAGRQTPGPAIGANSSAATARSTRRPRWRRARRCRVGSVPAWIRAARCKPRSTCRRATTVEI